MPRRALRPSVCEKGNTSNLFVMSNLLKKYRVFATVVSSSSRLFSRCSGIVLVLLDSARGCRAELSLEHGAYPLLEETIIRGR